MILERELAKQSVRTQAVYLLQIAGGFVMPSGIIFNREGRALSTTVMGLPADKHYRLPKMFRDISLRGVETIHGPVLIISKIGFRNYGHWLIEMLPRIRFLSHCPPDTQVLFGSPGGQLGEIIDESLSMCGVDRQKIKAITQPVYCEEIYHVTPHCQHPISVSPFVADFYRQFCADAGIFRRPTRKLFVSRAGARTRIVGNEEEIFSYLQDRYGYEWVSTVGLTLRQQAELFAQARSVAGISGAAMTNTIFAAGAPLCYISPASMPNLFFVNLADVFGSHYAEYKERRAKGTMFASSFDVSLDDFAAFFDSLKWLH